MADNDKKPVAEDAPSAEAAAGQEVPAEVLSEEEREALIEGVESGKVDNTPATPPGVAVDYDLASQDRITSGQLPVLEKINKNFVRYLQTGLEGMLQREVEVSAMEMETRRMSEYVHSLGVPTSLNYMALDPLPGEGLFIFDPELVFSVVDIYFGGDGKHVLKAGATDFTPTETHVTRMLINCISRELKQAWESVMGIDCKFIKSESNPQFSGLAASREMMVLCGFQLHFGEYGGGFFIGLPFSLLRPVRGLLEGGRQKSKVETEQAWLQGLKANLAEAHVELNGRIAQTQLNLRDVFNLQAGDVIPVEMPEQVTLKVHDIEMFSGQFGLHGGHNAVRITRRIKDPEET